MTGTALPPADLPTEASALGAHEPSTPAPDDPADSCTACAHPLAGHDALGVRFCAATATAALTRGCICR